MERSPSVPRNFRPSQFAFIPQPDFQSAREPSNNENIYQTAPEQNQNKKEPHHLLSSGHFIFQAPMRPLDVARTAYLDYTKRQLPCENNVMKTSQVNPSMERCY